MGGIAVTDSACRRAIADTIEDLGWHVSPDDAWLACVACALPLRCTPRAGRSGLIIAEWLQARPEVSRVLYPPLPGSVGHELWTRDFTGAASSLMGVVLKGTGAAGRDLLMPSACSAWAIPGRIRKPDHPQKPIRRPIARHHRGGLIRLHVGLEDPSDLIADLERGLAAFRAALTLP
ncbi:PLP-dependent transferase [Brevundimonas aurantiaca]|uniref:PLP-dependent transferase n=1 Tax=Brevundimonas aurantiaca TaxID=74316 RepID=UPI0021E5177F|nr:PLP-dependent transferase [Brevundimonas aurantiaca]